MAKRKNQDAAKRREAKKRRNTIKRKAQVRTATLHNIQAEYPAEYLSVKKLSEVILDYAEPLIKETDERQGQENAILMSITIWNASLLPKQEALESLKTVFDDMVNGDQQNKNLFYTMFERMYNRKQNQFSNDKRFIVDYFLDENNEGFYLQVVSTPIKA